MIGIFDSGVGGLTVAKEIFKVLPGYPMIYFGDTARLPYGTKGPDFIRKYSLKITDFLIRKGAKVIVVACHTSSAISSDFLREHFKGIPIFDVINPVVNEILLAANNRKVGIIGTPGTIKSGYWQKKLFAKDPNLQIYSKPCPLFVPLVEEGWMDKKITKEVIKEYLTSLKSEKIDVLVLACTHYPLLEKEIGKVVGERTKIVNPAKKLAKEIKQFLKDNPKISLKMKKGKKHQFFFSDVPYNLEKIGSVCFEGGIEIEPIIKDPFGA